MTDTKFKKKDIVAIYLTMNSLGQYPAGKFGYGISKNIKLITDEIESLKKAEEMSPEFKAYDDLRLELIQKYGKRDEKGELVMKGPNEYDLDEAGREAFEKEVKKLQKEHASAIEARVEQMKKYAEILEEDYLNAFFPYKIKFEDVPKSLSIQQQHGIYDLLLEPIDEAEVKETK